MMERDRGRQIFSMCKKLLEWNGIGLNEILYLCKYYMKRKL